MPHLLNRMPFAEKADEITVRGERVRIRADQILIWVSLSHENLYGLNLPGTPFPAILDTGHNHSFSINERQLHT